MLDMAHSRRTWRISRCHSQRMECAQELVDRPSIPKSSKANFAIHSRMSDEQDMQNESDQPPHDNAEDGEKALLQLAESFDPGQTRRSVLHQYKRGVLLLRAKHAPYEKIAAMLEKVGVKTSLFSVSRFCRQHRAEIKKLRVQLESRKPPPDQADPLAQNSVGHSSNRPAHAGASLAPAEQPQPTNRRSKF